MRLKGKEKKLEKRWAFSHRRDEERGCKEEES